MLEIEDFRWENEAKLDPDVHFGAFFLKKTVFREKQEIVFDFPV